VSEGRREGLDYRCAACPSYSVTPLSAHPSRPEANCMHEWCRRHEPPANLGSSWRGEGGERRQASEYVTRSASFAAAAATHTGELRADCVCVCVCA
jgi:hypothetical protein